MNKRSLKAARVSLAAFLVLGLIAAIANAAVTQQANLVLHFSGGISPRVLPRTQQAPVAVDVQTSISTTDGQDPPQLRHLEIEINRHGELFDKGLPICPVRRILLTTTEAARRKCKAAQVGTGFLHAHVALPEASPFPSRGRISAFNSRIRGRHVILAHVFGKVPLPITYVIAFVLHPPHNHRGTTLNASLPVIASKWGYLKSFGMTLHRNFTYRGKQRSFFTASCPAPDGFPRGTFTFARTTYEFAGGISLHLPLTRNCRVKG